MKATAMKNEKVIWLNEVPSHWDIVRLKTFVKGGTNGVWGSEPKSNKNDIVCVRVADIDEWQYGISESDLTYRNIQESDQNGRLLNYGDLIIEKSGGGEISPVGRVVIYNLNKKAVTSNFMARLNIVGDINKEFLYYYFRFLYHRRLNLTAIKATTGIQNLDLYAYLQNPIAVPTPKEQESIVEFINQTSGEINRFIQAKQRFIELLKEQRQSIITQAVTKGIDEGVKMKETGIDWMPEVPEHWEIRRLKYLVELYKHNKTQTNSNGYDFKLALENIDSWTGKYVETVNPDFEGEGKYFQNGDVLFGKLRPYLAKAFLPKTKGVCVSEILVFTPNSELITSEFLFQRILTKGFIDIVNGSTYGAKMPRAGWDFIGNMRIAYPPTIEEQKRIVEYIKAETRNIDIAISKAEREIELIKEYREALIAEAVTGKLKV